MRLDRAFLQLPIRFCPKRLASEVRALPASAWLQHPQSHLGNDAVPLVSPGGAVTNEMDGAMGPTPFLDACPYVRSIMAELDGVWGRSRLMGLAPNAEVPLHVDVHYYWRTHLRIHIPVITNPGVRFTCGEQALHMAEGECWVFDSFRPHRVENAGADKRVHLVLDTVGGERLWDLVEAAKADAAAPLEPWLPGSDAPAEIHFEQVNAPLVISPWEIRCHADYIFEHVASSPEKDVVARLFDRFIVAWQGAWSRFGTSEAGLPTYRGLISQMRSRLAAAGGSGVILDNEQSLAQTVDALIFWNAIARSPEVAHADLKATAAAPKPASNGHSYRECFERPIFIVSSPRSGSTLLFDTLVQAGGVYSPGGESHGLIENIPALSVPARSWTSNRLMRDDATPELAEQLARTFFMSLQDRDGTTPRGHARMIEKTPKNALRVPFFDAIWPDSEFVFLYRDPRQTMASMLEAWLSGGFRTYPNLPGWQGYPWSMLLIPGWQQLIGAQLPQIVAQQWATTVSALVDDLAALPRDRVRIVDYDEFLAAPRQTVAALATSLGLEWDRALDGPLPLSRTTVSSPAPDKWRKIGDVIESMMPIVAEADAKARAFAQRIRAAQEPSRRAAVG